MIRHAVRWAGCTTVSRVYHAVTLLFWALSIDVMHLCPPPSFSLLPLPWLPFIPPAFPLLTLRSFPLCWWVSQLTIWPTKDPKRLSSATVQAMTGWENEKELETERRYYVQYSLPSLIICHSCFLLCNGHILAIMAGKIVCQLCYYSSKFKASELCLESIVDFFNHDICIIKLLY